MPRFTKADITTHSTYDFSGPAINIKIYKFPHDRDGISAIQSEFGCTAEVAERALQFAYDAAQERFWELMREDHVPEIFGPGHAVFSMGRSGGWLYVTGLSRPLKEWDGRLVAKWGRLVRTVQEEIAYLTGWESVRDDIAANRWAEPGAEKYNYVDTGTETHFQSTCVVDLKRIEAAAPKLLAALKGMLEIMQWLQDSGNLKSPIEPHPFGLGVIDAKQQARSAIAEAEGKAVTA